MSDLTLATLLCSRICHDLISPVGAVNNGLEILDDESDAEMSRQAMALIRTSATNASAKLQFLRMAFGAAGSVSEAVPLDEARSLTEALVANGPVTLDWLAADVSLDKSVLRLLLNFILIGHEALPRGGTLRVGVRREGATNLMVSAEGPKARIPDAGIAILKDGAEIDAIEPRLSNYFLTHRIAAEVDAALFVQIETERVELAATL